MSLLLYAARSATFHRDAPKAFATGYVHYRGADYHSTLIVSDFDQTQQLFTVGVGVILLLFATVGWGLSGLKPKRDDENAPFKPA